MFISKFFFTLTITLLLAAGSITFVSCGDDKENDKPKDAQKTELSASVHSNTSQSPAKSSGKLQNKQQANPLNTGCKEDRINKICEKKCLFQCKETHKNRAAYYNAKKNKIADSPFEVKINRAYLNGSCAAGDDPVTRKSSHGINAIIEGEITYKGDDLLYSGELTGSMYLVFGKETYHEVPHMGLSSNRFRPKMITRITRDVRGADPWTKGETRPFHFESMAISEVFCESSPDETSVYMEIKTNSVNNGLKEYPLAFVNLPWDEVIGMALGQQITIKKADKNQSSGEPADAHYSKLNKILITRLTGKTEWIDRSIVVQDGDLKKGSPATFPTEGFSDEWKIKVTGVSTAKEFGGYTHKGEDQYLAIYDIEVTYKGKDEGDGEEEGDGSSLLARLETSPGKWQRTVGQSLGQIDLSQPFSAGSTVSGKVVFVRQRFERPFRMEIKTPDQQTVYIDVISYDIAPIRN